MPRRGAVSSGSWAGFYADAEIPTGSCAGVSSAGPSLAAAGWCRSATSFRGAGGGLPRMPRGLRNGKICGRGVSAAIVDPGDMRTRMHQEAFPLEDISDRPQPEVTEPFWNWLFDQTPAEISGERFAAQAEDARWLQRV